MWIFQGFWFQALKFPRGVTQFCGVSRSKALFGLEFPGGKVKNLKIPGGGGGFKKAYPQPPCLVLWLYKLCKFENGTKISDEK